MREGGTAFTGDGGRHDQQSPQIAIGSRQHEPSMAIDKGCDVCARMNSLYSQSSSGHARNAPRTVLGRTVVWTREAPSPSGPARNAPGAVLRHTVVWTWDAPSSSGHAQERDQRMRQIPQGGVLRGQSLTSITPYRQACGHNKCKKDGPRGAKRGPRRPQDGPRRLQTVTARIIDNL